MQNDPIRRLLDAAQLPDPELENEIALYAPKTAEPVNEDILDQRQQTHGEFGDNARVSQAIKRILRAEPGWNLLTDTEREAMDMIALKFSRLLSGKALELQHWEDVVGYARLAEKLCKGVSQ